MILFFQNGSSLTHWEELELNLMGINQGTGTWAEEYDWFFAGEQRCPFLEILSNNAKFFNCNQRHSFSQYNEFSNVLSRECEV